MNEQPKTLEEAAAHFRVSRRMIEPRVLSKEDAALYAGANLCRPFPDGFETESCPALSQAPTDGTGRRLTMLLTGIEPSSLR